MTAAGPRAAPLRRLGSIAIATMLGAAALTACSGTPEIDCSPTQLQLSIEGSSTLLEHAIVVKLGGGAGYTVYATDFEVDPETFDVWDVPETGTGEHLAYIAATTFNAVEEPERIEAGRTITITEAGAGLTFVTAARSGEDYYGDTGGAAGTMTVDAAGTAFCFSIDYSDNQKSMQGTVQALLVGEIG